MLSQPPKLPIMAHLVLGYPTLLQSLQIAESYIAAGVQILELQIPFSHPTADGPIITAACQEATRQGISLWDCIEAIRRLHERFPDQEIIVMSYVNRIYAFGFQEFIKEMNDAGIRHLIIPDLPVDCSAASDFFSAKTAGLLNLVPVLAANTSDERVEKLLAAGFDFFYLMSDFKITGSGFSLHPHLKKIVKKIKAHRVQGLRSTNLPDLTKPMNNSLDLSTERGHISPRVVIGFGISSPEQAKLVTQEADLAIIGSALIQAQNTGKLPEYLESLQQAFNAA
ncbi:MAG: tryptophan synthase subunit alpha [Saprospiraceae bacterium]